MGNPTVTHPRPNAIIGALHDCSRVDRMLGFAAQEKFYLDAVSRAGLTSVKWVGHDFAPLPDFAGALPIGGHTWYDVLAESGVGIYAFPEDGYVEIYVYVCNVTRDNTPKARDLFRFLADHFGAARIEQHVFPRGHRPKGAELTRCDVTSTGLTRAAEGNFRPCAVIGNLHGCRNDERMIRYGERERFYLETIGATGLSPIAHIGLDYPALPHLADSQEMGGHTWYGIFTEGDKESDIELHTFPEEGYVDFYGYVCSPPDDDMPHVDEILARFAEYYGATDVERLVVPRGFHPRLT